MYIQIHISIGTISTNNFRHTYQILSNRYLTPTAPPPPRYQVFYSDVANLPFLTDSLKPGTLKGQNLLNMVKVFC